MEIEPKDFIQIDQDSKTKKYNININRIYNHNISSSIISFNPTKNNFIYNFDYESNNQIIKLTHFEQLMFYIKYMKSIKSKQKDQIYKDLMSDSQDELFGKKINLDFYLEIFKNCYNDNQFILLSLFDLKNILLSPDLNYEGYSHFLSILEKKPEIIFKYCTDEESKNKYAIILYTIIFFVRFNYDKEKAMQMLENKDLWKYLIKILPVNANFFPNLEIHDELIQKMFEQDLNIEIINGILRLCGNMEKILDVINNNLDSISNCCIKENKLIIMSNLKSIKKDDNLKNIIEKMKKIITYERDNNKLFISFDNEFWKNYINYFENDLNKLLLLNEAIKLSKEMDKSLNIENLNLINKIQKIGLNLLKNGALNNEEFHQFIDFLLDKKENFIIKEEELFNTEKNIQSFNLLEAIQKYKLDNDDKIKEKFFKHILHIKDNIFDKIKKAEINFNSYKEIYSSQDKINVFKEKLRILFFHNQNEIEECMKILKEMKNIKILSKLEKLMQIFSEFFQNERKNEIVKIVNLRIRIQTGMMNEINKADIKKEIDEINNILSEEEFNKMDNYRNSIFFVQLYRLTKKNNNKKDEKDILKETETNFNELKYLFEEESWTLNISEPILNKCFHSIKNENDNILREELKKLMNIFSINDFNELKLEGLLKNINIYNKKEEVCLIAEACLYFIDELQIPKTEFSNKIERAKKELSLMKLNLNKIENLMKILEDNGLNISQTKEEDKNYLNVLKYIYEKKGALKFLSSLKSSDIPSLKELVESSDDTLLTGDDIKDMKQCKTFIDNLLSKTEKEKTDKILIQNLIVEVQKEKDIANKFKNYTNNFIEISNLLSKKLNLLPKPIQQIKQLMKEYSFIISLENNNEKPILSEELIYYEKTLDINIDQLIEYAKLINVKPTEKKELINLCRQFLDIIEQKENIKQLLKIIGEEGCGENMKIKIDINNNIPSFIFNDIKYDNYKDCYDFLDQLLLEITSIQNIYYEKNELIRYLNGKQINLQ